MLWNFVIWSGVVTCTIAGKLFFKPREQLPDSLCPDGLITCPKDKACCPTISGKYECCHISEVERLPDVLKMSAVSEDVDSVICPGQTAECPDGNTCCQLAGGHWGCCPLLNAVCCSDHTHCCPSGSTCDTSRGLCDKGTEQLPWLTKTLARTITRIDPSDLVLTSAVDREENPHCVVCPDGRSECPDGTTCCLMPGGMYGCCPLPDAVCCPDRIHCCPHFTTCDMQKSQCDGMGGERFPWLITFPVAAIKCDATKQCQTGQTCCKLASGSWGCCPLPQAVCCSDGVHCCPHDTTCDVSQGRCIKQDGTSYPWLQKSAALSRKVENVKCDSQYSCPTGDTCCKLQSGQWGCCPLPNAVCCSDGAHCCPHDTTCDVSQGRCIKQDGTSYPWLQKSAALSRKVEDVQCDSQYSCPTGDTCCKLQSGQWGCCPLPNAVCCSDGVHCCPHDTTCDVSQGRCIKQDGTSYPWLQKSAALSRKVETVKCDSQYSCPTGDTCCKLVSGQWGCCPLPNAVCCSDGVHCCPRDTTCDVSQGRCIRKDGTSYPWLQKSAALSRKVENVKCDSQYSCPTGDTCCKLQSGQWGCCPLPMAVCCSDGVHCCPHDTTCDVSQGRCIKQDGTSYPWLQKSAALSRKVETVKCDSQYSCPTGDTCCKLVSGQWGCCPLPNAVCCSDGVHCCPRDTTCDVSQGRCIRKDGTSYPWLQKSTALSRKVENVKCDSQYSCPTGDTCCKLQSGQWGCCPLPMAVCCSDGVHCCPHDTTCDVSQGRCIKQDGTSYPWLQKSAALSRKVETVKCDSQYSCPTGDTCCKLQSGQWGCCPLPNAVCCSDGAHCCPHDTTCDVSQGRCIKQDGTSYPWLQKSAALSRKVETVKCDSQYSCPSGDTCCKLVSGQWGCCPLPNAVCCSDGVHCCPHDTTCDVSHGRCIKQDGTSYPWLQKSAAISKKVENVKCDSQYSCPTGDTCCKLLSGQWGCCPLPNAVCCSDGVHCCPHDTTCDVSQGRCIKQDGTSYPWLQKSTALSTTVENVKCDTQYSCPSGDTCCKLVSGQWGCCPLPNAVCCSDGVHCCPHDTTCDVSQGRCIKQDGTSYPWLQKSSALFNQVQEIKSTILQASKNIVCPDGRSECPDGSTCCKEKSGQYGCCPLLSAVCCSDGLHCCPQGTTCDVAAGTCNRGSTKLPWHDKLIASTRENKIKNIRCPDSRHCPDNFTCCPIGSNKYGCCPLAKATCCADMVHCCPQGHTCDPSTGRCIKPNNIIPFIRSRQLP
ncbi:multiple epidermal growth factor-like domains protein 6 isoform X3 [Gigantopelta aegis]|uniref:multiple epidermal growth factor-like domains protein 6 isoform X3 n=1 Tax=Gigantopelta aegis TaxID=1735272 RepID=UPI001B88C361|nr:multiple epidermal growth factor-like domains protein 6 isoform X3 [Gigantopelta aegis]